MWKALGILSHLVAGRVSAFCRLNYKLGFPVHLGWKYQNSNINTVIGPVLTAACVEVEGSALNKPNTAATSLHGGGPSRPRPVAAQGQCLAGEGLLRFNVLPEAHGLQTRPCSQVLQDGRVIVNDQNGVNREDFLEGAPGDGWGFSLFLRSPLSKISDCLLFKLGSE